MLVPSPVLVLVLIVSNEVDSPVVVVVSSIAVALPLGSSVVASLVLVVPAVVLVLFGPPVPLESDSPPLAEPVLVGVPPPVVGAPELLPPALVEPLIEEEVSLPSPLSPGRAPQPASATPSATPMSPVEGAGVARSDVPQKGHAEASLNT